MAPLKSVQNQLEAPNQTKTESEFQYMTAILKLQFAMICDGGATISSVQNCEYHLQDYGFTHAVNSVNM